MANKPNQSQVNLKHDRGSALRRDKVNVARSNRAGRRASNNGLVKAPAAPAPRFSAAAGWVTTNDDESDDVPRSSGLAAQLRAHAYPLSLTLIGLGWLAARQWNRAGRRDGTAGGMRRMVQTVLDASAEMADDGKRRAEESLAELAAAAQLATKQAATATRSVYREAIAVVQTTFEAHPVALGGALLAAGVLTGYVVPASTGERKLLSGLSSVLAGGVGIGTRRA